MRLATANVRNTPDMPRRKVVADAAEIAPHADVIFFQEIGEAEDHDDVVKGLGAGWTVEHFGGNPNPIAYRTGSLKVVDRGVRVFHGGLAHVSGPRSATWIETADGVVLLNTHFVSGAWNSKPLPAKDWRKARWTEHYAGLKALVREFRSAGKTVVFGGDWNRQSVRKFARAQVWIVGEKGGIDKVAVLPAKGDSFAVRGRVNVLDLNSDHDARIVDVTVTKRPVPAEFKAATWNVFHGTAPERLRPVLRRMRADGVSLFLFQEISTPSVRAMVAEEGLKVAFAPRQYAVAYDPEVWERVTKREHVRLGETAYYATGGSHEQYSDAVRIVLRHKASGKTLDALSYHTPAHVQVTPSGRPPRRMQALRESMATLKRLADEKRADAVLYGGDDNVDEDRAFAEDFRFMLATGLRQVQAPSGTHGKRRIDDFRVRGLRPLDGYVVENASDHDAHVREFRFR